MIEVALISVMLAPDKQVRQTKLTALAHLIVRWLRDKGLPILLLPSLTEEM
jgi:hypothetical protein